MFGARLEAWLMSTTLIDVIVVLLAYGVLSVACAMLRRFIGTSSRQSTTHEGHETWRC